MAKVKKAKKEKSAIDIESLQSSKDIPYYQSKISCVCGAEYEAGSTFQEIRLEICAACHPFFTGESKILDAEGRVEKFKKKYNLK